MAGRVSLGSPVARRRAVAMLVVLAAGAGLAVLLFGGAPEPAKPASSLPATVIDGLTFGADCGAGDAGDAGSSCIGPDGLAVTSDARGGFVVVFDGEFRSGDLALWARRIDARGMPVAAVRRLRDVDEIGPPIELVAGLRGTSVVVQRAGEELVLDRELRVGRRRDAGTPPTPTDVIALQTPAGVLSFVVPGTPGFKVYVDAASKHVSVAGCDVVECVVG